MTRTFGYFGGEELWHRAVEVVNSKADQSKEIVGLTVCYFVCEKLSRDLNENSRTESMPIFQKGMAIDTEKLMINHFSPTKERYCYGLFLPSSNKLEPKSKGFEMNKRNCPEVSKLAQAQWVTGRRVRKPGPDAEALLHDDPLFSLRSVQQKRRGPG